jgi:hypothetical protein
MNPLEKERNEQKLRLPYHTPQLQIYGDLRQITQTNMNGAPDHVNPQGTPVPGTAV